MTPASEMIQRSRQQAANRLLEWAETTHGERFGHDHHCKVQVPAGREWVEVPKPDDGCTCGWSAFLLAYDAIPRARP
jgi:hypothetical protein